MPLSSDLAYLCLFLVWKENWHKSPRNWFLFVIIQINLHQVFDHEQIKIDSINVRSEFIDSIIVFIEIIEWISKRQRMGEGGNKAKQKQKEIIMKEANK